jgi:hypothetical protein
MTSAAAAADDDDVWLPLRDRQLLATTTTLK